MTNKQQVIKSTNGVVDDEYLKQFEEGLQVNSSNLRRWLLGEFEEQRQFLNNIQKRMIDDNVSKELSAAGLVYETSPEEIVRKETIKLVTNSKTGDIWDIPTLENAGKLSSAEIDSIRTEHNYKDPPYVYISDIRRVLDNRVQPPKEYLSYTLRFEGISVGKRAYTVSPDANMRINETINFGYRLLPKIIWTNARDRDGEEKRIARWNGNIIDDASARQYFIPYDKRLVDILMQHTLNGEVSFSFTNLKTQKHYGVKDYETFTAENLEAAIEEIERPRATYNFNVQPEKLAKYLQMDEAAKEQKHYG